MSDEFTPFEKMMLSSKSKTLQDIGKKAYKARTGKEHPDTYMPPGAKPGQSKVRWIKPSKKKKHVAKKTETVVTEEKVETKPAMPSKPLEHMIQRKKAEMVQTAQKTTQTKQEMTAMQKRAKFENMLLKTGNKAAQIIVRTMQEQDVKSKFNVVSKPIKNLNKTFLVIWEKPSGETVRVLVKGNALEKTIKDIPSTFNGRVLQIREATGDKKIFYNVPSSSEIGSAYTKTYEETGIVPFVIKKEIIQMMEREHPEEWKQYKMLGLEDEFVRYTYEKSLGITPKKSFTDIFNRRAWSNEEWVRRYGTFKVNGKEVTWSELKRKEPALYLEKTDSGQYLPTYDYSKWHKEYGKQAIKQVGKPLYYAKEYMLGYSQIYEPKFWASAIFGGKKGLNEYIGKKEYEYTKKIESGKGLESWGELQYPAWENVIGPFLTVAGGSALFAGIGKLGEGGQILSKYLPYVVGTAFFSTAGAEIGYTAAMHKEEPLLGFGSKEAFEKELGLGMQIVSGGAGAKWATSPETKAYFSEKVGQIKEFGGNVKNVVYEKVPLAGEIGGKIKAFKIQGMIRPYQERFDVKIASAWDRFARERGLKLFESPEEKFFFKAKMRYNISKFIYPEKYQIKKIKAEFYQQQPSKIPHYHGKPVSKTELILGDKNVSMKMEDIFGKIEATKKGYIEISTQRSKLMPESELILGGERESMNIEDILGKHELLNISRTAKTEIKEPIQMPSSIQESGIPSYQKVRIKTKMLINPEKPYELYFASETVGSPKKYSFGKINTKGWKAKVEGYTFEENEISKLIPKKEISQRKIKAEIIGGKKGKIEKLISERAIKMSEVDLSDYLKTSFSDLTSKEIANELESFWGKIRTSGGKKFTSNIENKYIGELKDLSVSTSKGTTKYYKREMKFIEKYAKTPEERLPFPKRLTGTMKGYKEIPDLRIESTATSLQKNAEFGNKYIESQIKKYNVVVSKGKFKSAGEIKGTYGEFINEIVSVKPSGKEKIYYGEHGGFDYRTLTENIGEHLILPGGITSSMSKIEYPEGMFPRMYSKQYSLAELEAMEAGIQNTSVLNKGIKSNAKKVLPIVGVGIATDLTSKQVYTPAVELKMFQEKDIIKDMEKELAQLKISVSAEEQIQEQISQEQIELMTDLNLNLPENSMDIGMDLMPPVVPETEEPYVPHIPILNERQKARQYVTGAGKKGNAYDVLVKERSMYHGKVRKPIRFKKENIVPLSKKEAMGLGATIADNTSAVSFKIKKTSGSPKKSLLPHKSFESIKHKFTKKGDVYIEKPKYRMDTVGEIKGITKLGWESNKINVKKINMKNLFGKKKKKGGNNVRYI